MILAEKKLATSCISKFFQAHSQGCEIGFGSIRFLIHGQLINGMTAMVKARFVLEYVLSSCRYP